MYDWRNVEASIQAIDRAGFSVVWTPAAAPGCEQVLTATSHATGEVHTARAVNPLKALTELQRLCGFEAAK